MRDAITSIAVPTVFTLLACFGMFAVGGSTGLRMGREAAQREAVEHGAGRWTINPQTGERGFEWIANELSQ